jgi:hypothetical protein
MKGISFVGIVVLLGGCGGNAGVDADNGGADIIMKCGGACARAASTCGLDQTACLAYCGNNVVQSQALGCGDLEDKLLTCIQDAPDDLICSGPLVPASCQSDSDGWEACFSAGPGG